METEKYTKEIMSMIKEMDGVFINGQMVLNTKENGSKINNMVLVATFLTKTASQNLVNGIKINASNGSQKETN